MATQVTVTIPDNVYKRAQSLADMIGRDVETILAMMLELSLPRYSPEIDLTVSVDSLPDDELLAVTELQLIPEQSQRYSLLLYRQQNETLSLSEKNELSALNRVYELGIVYQSQALADAHKRGLIKELDN